MDHNPLGTSIEQPHEQPRLLTIAEYPVDQPGDDPWPYCRRCVGVVVVRTDLPWKGLIGGMVLVPYILPSWVLSLAWLTMFRYDGLLPYRKGLLQYLTGVSVPSSGSMDPCRS